MKIYTKTGDQGETSLFGGRRVQKDHLRIKAYGDVDELNAILGVCASLKKSAILKKLQHLLFIAGADLAAQSEIKTERIKKAHVIEIEKIIDRHDSGLPVLQNFILPGGSSLAAHLHLARTVCRRVEREVVALQKKEKINPNLLPWFNRLSDLLFVLARHANKTAGAKEEKWNKKGNKS